MQQEPLTREDFIRFHVIANSDSREDQELKLAVRDRILEEIEPDLKEMTSIENTRTYIIENRKKIEALAEEIIREAGMDYGADSSLGIRWIPEKTYGSITFPAGTYEAFTIELGEAGGQNWWCVMFPPLCLIGEEAEKEETSVEDDSENNPAVKLRKEEKISSFIAEKYEPLLRSAETGEPLVLKFKTAEIAESIGKSVFYN